MSSHAIYIKKYESYDSTAHYPGEELILWHKSQGSILISEQGDEYIDLSSAFGTLPLGHNPPEIIETLQNYLKQNAPLQGMGDVYATTAKAQLLKTLSDFLPPGFEKISLCVTGSDSVELALKTALLTSQKPGILACENSYHGLSLGALSVTGLKKFHTPFPALWNENPQVRFFKPHHTLQDLKKIIQESHHQAYPIGQLIIEPILGRGGGIEMNLQWLQELQQMLQEQEVLLIFDEILTGMGRCGVPFIASKVAADILCLGKALGGGMPLSATVASEKIMKNWPLNTGEALHTGTFFGHALSCEVSCITLEEIQKQNLITRCQDLGTLITEWMNSHVLAHKTVKEYRGFGAMGFLELSTPQKGVQLSTLLRKQGVIALPGGAQGEGLFLTPAYNIPHKLLEQALQTLLKALDQL